MIFDGDMQVRHVYMDVPHSANVKPSWYGESVGHYEGDTLVVDTIGQTTKTVVDAYRTPHSDKLHVVERWRMVDNGDTLEVLVTVDDSDTYNQPWQGLRRYLAWEEGQLGEQICAEGNFCSSIMAFRSPRRRISETGPDGLDRRAASGHEDRMDAATSRVAALPAIDRARIRSRGARTAS